jgi:RND family efflux transporter MFP subunit
VVFAVPENRLNDVRPGQAVDVQRWSSDQRYVGTVREVAASADPVTRTYTVKLALAGEAPPLGATVTAVPRAAVAQSVSAAIKLPTSALFQQGQGSAVWVYDATTGTVRAQPIQVSTVDGNEAVVSAGLKPGMQVVATGTHVLAPGQKVTVYKSHRAPAQDQSAQETSKSVAEPQASLTPAGGASAPTALTSGTPVPAPAEVASAGAAATR